MIKKQDVKKKYVKKFYDRWLTEAKFKDWIEVKCDDKDGGCVPFCNICKAKLSCSKTALFRHAERRKHKELFKMQADLTKSHAHIGIFMNSSLPNAVGKVEIKVASFIVDHNLPINLSEDLVALLSSLVPNDKTVQKATLENRKQQTLFVRYWGLMLLKSPLKT